MEINPLVEAEALYKRRKWPELIQALEALGPMYRDSARYAIMLGVAYVYTDDVGSAYSCFRRAQSLDFRNTEAALGLAAVYIRRAETDKAVQLYIDILDRDPSNATARRGLALIRKGNSELLSGKRLRCLYPRPRFSYRRLLLQAAGLVVIAFLVWAFPALIRAARPRFAERPGIAAIALSDEEAASPVGSAGGFVIVLSEAEARAAFAGAKKLFSAYRDEAALVELNRLLLSNATRQVKAKAEALSHYVREPSFSSMPDRYSYKDVMRFPKLYEGVGIVWKGMPANIQAANGAALFDLLVGYQSKTQLEGIVSVATNFPCVIAPDRPIEVLARVRVQSDGSIGLECLAVHEL